MINLIDRDTGEPSFGFQEQVRHIAENFVQHYKNTPDHGDFYSVSILDINDNVSHWGIIDMATIPEEDVYISLLKRWYAGVRNLEDHEIKMLQLLDVRMVVARAPIPTIPF